MPYEIEIKSLLGGQDKAEDLRQKMTAAGPSFKVLGESKQLNHYFTGGGLAKIFEPLTSHIVRSKKDAFDHITHHAKDFSLRTRQDDDQVLLVIKASIDDTTSENGTARQEFEAPVDLTLDELDKLILTAGFQYQAKWSRERQSFEYKGATATIDKNAGYGYLAEFESVIDDHTSADTVKQQLRSLMKELDLEELPQDRLQRMFEFYNQHWSEYYGTNKTFTIE